VLEEERGIESFEKSSFFDTSIGDTNISELGRTVGPRVKNVHTDIFMYSDYENV
jgi:hypothetical protein